MKKNLFLFIIVAILVLLFVGCKRHKKVEPTEAPPPQHNNDIVNSPEQLVFTWIYLIENAGFNEYAALAKYMMSEGRIKFVAPPMLDADYNAFTWLDTDEIWINKPMFTRYPNVLDQATIFLHELIHIKSREQTHNGPWWSAQDEFLAYYKEHPQEIPKH